MNPISSLRLKRLALCTAAAAMAAAVLSGPAQAEGGLSGLLNGTAEQLPPPLAAPVAEVASTLAPVEQALPPVAQEAVDDVAETTGGVVEAALPVVPAVPEVPGLTSPASDNAPPPTGANPAASTPVSAPASVSEPAGNGAPIVDAATPPVGTQETPAPAVAVPVAGPAQRERTVRSPIVSLRTPEAAPTVREVRRASGESPRAGFVPTEQAPVVVFPPVADAPAADRAPVVPFWPWPEVRLPGFGLSLTAGAAGLLFAALLALLLLAAPALQGTLLRSAVPERRSADVQFRLVRPG